MSKTIRINFNKNHKKFIQKLKEETSKNQNYDLIIIENTPKIDDAKNLTSIIISSFRSGIIEHQNLFGLNFHTNEVLGNDLEFAQFEMGKLLMVSFQSTFKQYKSKTFWRLPGNGRIHSTYIDEDSSREVTSSFHCFLLKQLKNKNSGVLREFQDQSEIRMDEICSNEKENLLMFAVLNNQPIVVQELLNREFDVNFANCEREVAIDYAWTKYTNSNDENDKNTASNIILQLLKMNSKLPKYFDYTKASKEVQEFIDMCENLHRYLNSNNLGSLNEKLDQNPNLTYFYDRNKTSLLLHALSIKNLSDDFILSLIKRGLNFGPYEELLKDVKIKLKRLHLENSKECPEVHILKLRSRTFIGNNHQFPQHYWNLVDDAYKTLESNKLCSKMLKVAAESKYVKFYFDFKHDTVYYMDPTGALGSKGRTHRNGTIYVGAKYLRDEKRKFLVLSYLAHELCHVVMLLTFFNPNFDPFPMGESPAKTRYLDAVMEESKIKKDSEEIVKNAFKSYKPELQPSELVVTVAQMMMHYLQNEDKILELRQKFKELFSYVEEIVEPELERAVKVLKCLNDKKRDIKFQNLTEPMKARISHKEINLQGQKTTFFESIESDSQILDQLTSQNIRDVLIKNIMLKFSEICQLNLKYELVERSLEMEQANFDNRKIYRKSILLEPFKAERNDKINKYNILGIRYHDIKDTEIVILADYSGSGKSTTFINYAIKLKNDKKNFWVSFVNLRKQQEIFEKFQSKNGNFNDFFIEMLLEMVEAKTEVEKLIFKKLFSTNRVALLFDGVDEVCPKYSEFLMKVFQFWVQNGTENQLWISTRPHYAKKLEEVLIPIKFFRKKFKFKPYTSDQIDELIKNVLKGNKIQDSQKFEDIFGKVKKQLSFSSTKIDNPLIVIITTELNIKNISVDLNNRYALYSAMTDQQKLRVGDKIPNEDRDADEDLTIWQIYQILALILIIDDIFDLNSLQIMKCWNEKKKTLMADTIQRYGLVNLVNMDSQSSSITFAHRSIAEFFVAQFFIKAIFSDNYRDSDDEVSKIFDLLHMILSSRFQRFGSVCEFIFSYIENDGKYKILHRIVKDSIIKRIPDLNFGGFENYNKIAIVDEELLRKLWKIDNLVKHDDWFIFRVLSIKNMVEKYALKDDNSHSLLIYMSILAESSFGPNWHENFNRSHKKLIRDEEILSYKDSQTDDFDWIMERNLLKICDLVDKSFNFSDRKKFYNNFKLSNLTSSKICVDVIKRMINSIGLTNTTKKVFDYDRYNDITTECLVSMFHEIEKGSDRDSMRDLLGLKNNSKLSLIYFLNYSRHFLPLNQPLLNAINLNDPDKFIFLKNFYIKYKNSWDEVQEIFLKCDSDDLMKAVALPIYPQYKEFINDVFGANKIKIQEKLEIENTTNTYELTNMKNFLLFIYSNDERKVSQILDSGNYS